MVTIVCYCVLLYSIPDLSKKPPTILWFISLKETWPWEAVAHTTNPSINDQPSPPMQCTGIHLLYMQYTTYTRKTEITNVLNLVTGPSRSDNKRRSNLMLRSDNTVLSCCMIYLYHVKNKMLNNRNMFDNYSKILDINQQWITVQMIAFPLISMHTFILTCQRHFFLL